MIDLGEYGAGFTRDPYPVYAALRERGPVHWVRTPQPGAFEGWLVVGYEEARATLVDPRLSKDTRKAGPSSHEEELMGRHVLSTDPPEHTRLRSLVTGAFTMRRVEALRPRVQQITDELLDEMLPKGAPTSSTRSPIRCRSPSSASCSASRTSTGWRSARCRTRS